MACLCYLNYAETTDTMEPLGVNCLDNLGPILSFPLLYCLAMAELAVFSVPMVLGVRLFWMCMYWPSLSVVEVSRSCPPSPPKSLCFSNSLAEHLS